jgi:hypothetical protein
MPAVNGSRVSARRLLPARALPRSLHEKDVVDAGLVVQQVRPRRTPACCVAEILAISVAAVAPNTVRGLVWLGFDAHARLWHPLVRRGLSWSRMDLAWSSRSGHGLAIFGS